MIHSKTYKISCLLLSICLLALTSCQKSYNDAPDENYQELFPWQGISQPVRDKWNINPRPCTPNAELTSYIYNPIKRLTDSHTYTVTVRCTFREKGSGESLSTAPTARYRVLFIDAQGKYQAIGSPREDSKAFAMTNGQEFVHSFTAYSGYPLFISVSGLGPQGSSIKAHIEAISQDGMVRIDPIGTEQYQNSEGPNHIKQPYCEYVLLP